MSEGRLTFLESWDAELKRAWATFPDPVAENQGECWQYMGTVETEPGVSEHQFRHRCDPANGGERSYKRVPALLNGVPKFPEPAQETPTSSPNRPNRYSGACAACGQGVPRYAGSISKRAGKWVIHCPVCVGKAPSGWDRIEGGKELITIETSSGWVGTRNKRGRCEDAPCCGCCTF